MLQSFLIRFVFMETDSDQRDTLPRLFKTSRQIFYQTLFMPVIHFIVEIPFSKNVLVFKKLLAS